MKGSGTVSDLLVGPNFRRSIYLPISTRVCFPHIYVYPATALEVGLCHEVEAPRLHCIGDRICQGPASFSQTVPCLSPPVIYEDKYCRVDPWARTLAGACRTLTRACKTLTTHCPGRSPWAGTSRASALVTSVGLGPAGPLCPFSLDSSRHATLHHPLLYIISTQGQAR